MKCPNCGNSTVTFKSDPHFKNKESGYCPCNPHGAVISRPVKKRATKAKVITEEKPNGDAK